jgi:hypothetical protein
MRSLKRRSQTCCSSVKGKGIGGDSLTPTYEEIRKFGLVNMPIATGTLHAQ